MNDDDKLLETAKMRSAIVQPANMFCSVERLSGISGVFPIGKKTRALRIVSVARSVPYGSFLEWVVLRVDHPLVSFVTCHLQGSHIIV